MPQTLRGVATRLRKPIGACKMNERIKKLAEQATTEEHDGFRYFDKAKFAELIVRECVKEMGRYEFIDVAMREVKEHFGVE